MVAGEQEIEARWSEGNREGVKLHAYINLGTIIVVV
jgi:hypothetical protein